VLNPASAQGGCDLGGDKPVCTRAWVNTVGQIHLLNLSEDGPPYGIGFHIGLLV